MTTGTRRAPRFRVRGLNMIYDTGESFWSGPVVNMSESGLFIETHHRLQPGTMVVLMPDLTEDEKLPFEIRAEVVRVDEYDLDEHWDRTPGIAFRLRSLSDANLEQLRDYLEAHGVPVLRP